jgi:hypothetical protein
MCNPYPVFVLEEDQLMITNAISRYGVEFALSCLTEEKKPSCSTEMRELEHAVAIDTPGGESP